MCVSASQLVADSAEGWSLAVGVDRYMPYPKPEIVRLVERVVQVLTRETVLRIAESYENMSLNVDSLI